MLITRENQVLDPLALLHFDNRLSIFSYNIKSPTNTCIWKTWRWNKQGPILGLAPDFCSGQNIFRVTREQKDISIKRKERKKNNLSKCQHFNIYGITSETIWQNFFLHKLKPKRLQPKSQWCIKERWQHFFFLIFSTSIYCPAVELFMRSKNKKIYNWSIWALLDLPICNILKV